MELGIQSMGIESRFFVDKGGKFLGTYVGVTPSSYAAEVPFPPPESGLQIWDFVNEFWVWPEKTVDEKKAAIAARRYQAETAGITFSGMPLATDRDSQGLINGAALSAYTDATYVCRWKTDAGFVTLDATTLKAVAKAIRDHVQACFDREAVLLSAVSAGTYTDSMLEQGWPS